MSDREVTERRRSCDVGDCKEAAYKMLDDAVASCEWCNGDVCGAHGKLLSMRWTMLQDDSGERTHRIDRALICDSCAKTARAALRAVAGEKKKAKE